MKVKIAVAQMNCKMGEVRANLQTIEKLSSSVLRKQINFLCFPELATTGYSLDRLWRKCAEPIPGNVTEELGKIAIETGSYLIFGVDELDPKTNSIYDSAVLIDPQGKIQGTYRKVHLWDKERSYFTHGDGFPVFETKFGKVGLGICYDIEFPEPARIMAAKGARIIFFPSAEMSPMEDHINTYLKSRSAENRAFVAFSNRTGTEFQTRFFGQSQVVSPECKVLAKATTKNPLAIAEIDLKLLDKLKSNFPYLEQRVPEAYSGLIPSRG
jgi:predicted amidohydrolase